MIARRTALLARILALFPALLAVAVRAEERSPVVLPGESHAAALRLTDARKKLDDQQWSEAIQELQTILNTAGDDLVAVTPTHSVRAGRLCQIQLASLPAEALRLYRRRYEPQAQKKFEQARSERDVVQLRKLIEEAFCTRAAEKALDLLGDLAFERGRFAEAEEWWRLLAPLPDVRRDAAVRGVALVYPDPSLDPARLQAKQLLARLFRGQDSEWPAALEAYGERHGKAEGTLAGRKGRYVEVLHALAQEQRKQGHAEREDWVTFGGDPSRGRVAPASEDVLDHLSALCRDGPTWTFNLQERARQEDGELAPAVNAEQARTLAFYPIVVGHQVLVADARRVTAFDLRNGRSEHWYDVAGNNGGVEVTSKLPAPPDLRYTLTAAGDLVYVRLGAQNIGLKPPPPPARFGPPAKPGRENETFLACLGLRTRDRAEHLRWKIDGVMPHDEVLFEGAPVVANGLIWSASTRYNGGRRLSAIDCYSADDSSAPPRRWRREVCDTGDTKSGEPRYGHHLLTLAGTQIVYCTHTGAVVAVDALTGRRNWAIRYPRRTTGAEEKLRDLAPVLFAAGRLYAAPADSDNLLCLDPATGRTLWELETVSVVHLLGVGQGRLIFTTPQGLRAVSADDGNPAWSVPDSGALTPAGRGLLIGDLVLFPTTQQRGSTSPENVVYALRQRDGQPADDPAKLHRLPAGNLVYANGCLAVADRRTLSVFVPQRLLLSEREAEVRGSPDSSSARLNRARSQADAGRLEEALEALRQAEDRLRTTTEPKATLHRIRDERQRLWLEVVRRAAAEQRWEDAETALRRALAVPMPPRGRLHALLRAVQIYKDAGQPAHSRTIGEMIQRDETLRSIQVIDREGRPASVSSALAHLGERGRVSAPRSSLGALTQPRSPASARGANATSLAGKYSLPLFRTWHAQLASDEWILAGWQQCDSELLLTGSPDGRFRCRLTSTGDIRWQHRLPFAPRWAGCHVNTLLAGGADGVACLRRDNGELLWHFSAPVAGRYPRAPTDEVRVLVDPQPPEPLSDFRLAAGRLFFLQGRRRLFAVDAESGGVLWDRWAPDGALRLPSPQSCFSTCYHAGTETVLVQACRRRWLLDAATGHPLHEAADSCDLWQRSPLALDERTLCVTPDCRNVLLLDAHTGKCLWTHPIAGSSTRSGEIPSVLGCGDVLICVQPANIGYYLQRLDRATGKPLWPRPQLLAVRSLDLNDWSFDSQAVYGIEDHYLIARSLMDGKVLWRRALQAGEAWQARRLGDYLAVFAGGGATTARFRFRSPLGAVQWNLGSLLVPDAISPLSWYDPKTGQLVQRLNFRIEAPLRTTFAKRSIPHESGPAPSVRTSSLLASERGPVVRLASPRPFVALGGEVWGLSANGQR